jgi:predicted metalloprotease
MLDVRFRKDARLDTSQVQDVRGGGRRVPGGKPMAIGGGGGIIAVIVVLAITLFGGGGGLGDLGALSGQAVGPGVSPAASEVATECRTGEDANEREDCRIVGVINSVQAYWSRALRGYEPTKTVFYDGVLQTGCGPASAEVGPFYCPQDRQVYIDLGFFDQLQSELGASGGPLAEAYVLAHEYGHYVQDLTGVLRSAGRDTGPQGGQVRVELQADCYAGLWVGNALETGYIEDITRQDVADALDAAAAVGDDRIQSRAQGRVIPESFTHGSAEQRQSWFVRGIEATGPQSCDTFRGQV